MAFAKGLYHNGRLWSMCAAGKRHMAAAGMGWAGWEALVKWAGLCIVGRMWLARNMVMC